MKFKGIYTPVVTPYYEDFVCNEEALAETIEFLIKSGVNGLVIAGSTGEYYAQTMKERIKLMEISVMKKKINYILIFLIFILITKNLIRISKNYALKMI